MIPWSPEFLVAIGIGSVLIGALLVLLWWATEPGPPGGLYRVEDPPLRPVPQRLERTRYLARHRLEDMRHGDHAGT